MRTFIFALALLLSLPTAHNVWADIVYSVDQTFDGANGRGDTRITGFFRVTSAGIPNLFLPTDLLDWSLTFSSPTNQENPITLTKSGVGNVDIVGAAAIESTPTELIFHVPSVSLGSMEINAITISDTDGESSSGGNPSTQYLTFSEDLGVGFVFEVNDTTYHDGVGGEFIAAGKPFQNSFVFGTVAAVPEPSSVTLLAIAIPTLLGRRRRCPVRSSCEHR